MSRPQWTKYIVSVALITIFAIVVFFPELGSYGLWEPWEVDRIEEAISGQTESSENDSADSEGGPRTTLEQRLISWGYNQGPNESSLRLHSAAIAVIGLIVAFILGIGLFGFRASAYGTIVLIGIPLYLTSGKLLVWSGLPILAHTLILGGGAFTCFGPFKTGRNFAVGLSVTILGTLLGALSIGWFLGVSVPLVGVALGMGFLRVWRKGPIHLASMILFVLGSLSAISISYFSDLMTLERFREAPTFISVLRLALVGTFPWTGLIVVGLVSLVHHEDESEKKSGSACLLFCGAITSIVVQTFWVKSTGITPLITLWPLAIGAGLVLDRLDSESKPRRIAALICALFMALGIRDLIQDPAILLAFLGEEVEYPEELGGKMFFAFTVGILLVTLVMGLARGSSKERFNVKEYKQWIINTFSWFVPKQKRLRIGLIIVLGLLFVHGMLAMFVVNTLWFPYMGSLERRIWFGVGALVPALFFISASAKLIWELIGQKAIRKGLAVVIVGAGLTIALSHVAIPEASLHLSTREVLRVYERLNETDHPLYVYRSPARAAKMIGDIEIEAVSSHSKLVDLLEKGRGVFALIKSDDLARIDSRYRQKNGEHIPVADTSNSSTYLVASDLPEDRNINPLIRIVPEKRPRPSHPSSAVFESKIELLGIDIEGRNGTDEVYPMDSFVLRFYWHCKRRVSGNKEIFVHVDGFGLRINGDHHAANGLYKVKNWQPGDYIIDEMTLKIPPHFRPGNYGIYVGFFQGSKRMKISGGSKRSDNRAKVGTLKVR